MHMVRRSILIINNSANLSGAEKSLLDVVDVLSVCFRLIIVIPDKGKFYYYLSQKDCKVELVKMRRIKVGQLNLKSISIMLDFFRTSTNIIRIIRRENVDFIYTNGSQAQTFGVFLKLITGKKLIWHVRDTVKAKWLSLIFSFFSNKIICISDFIFNQIYLKRKAAVIYNGISISHLILQTNQERALKKQFGIPQDGLLIAHVASLIPWKRHELFIDLAANIIKEYSNVYFIIIGDDLFADFPEYKLKLMDMVQMLNLNQKLFFAGFRDDIASDLAEIDVLVHFALGEPFGRVLIEAMALQKPVIAFNSGALPEIISDGTSGFVIPEGHLLLAEQKLKFLLNSKEIREGFGKEGCKIAGSKFSVSNLNSIMQLFINVDKSSY